MKLIRSFTLLSALGTIACTSSLDPGRLLEVKLSTNRDVVSAEQPVEITVTVTNRSSIVVSTAAAESYGCGHAFVVLNAMLRELRLPGRICLAIVGYLPKNLLPGESIVIRDAWAGEAADADGRPMNLPPGRYFLKARVFADGGRAESSTVGIKLE